MTMRPRVFTVVLLGAAVVLLGADWPQFRGPQRDGVSRETGLRTTWPAGGPPLLWTFNNSGIGYSGPAVVGRPALRVCRSRRRRLRFRPRSQGQADGAAKEVWAAKLGPLFTWKGNNWNAGPNATPTVDGDRVYALGGRGDLVCVEAATGKEVWRKNLPRDLGGEVNPIGGGAEEPTPLGWGYASARWSTATA